jgi:hypothetical protein
MNFDLGLRRRLVFLRIGGACEASCQHYNFPEHSRIVAAELFVRRCEQKAKIKEWQI